VATNASRTGQSPWESRILAQAILLWDTQNGRSREHPAGAAIGRTLALRWRSALRSRAVQLKLTNPHSRCMSSWFGVKDQTQ